MEDGVKLILSVLVIYSDPFGQYSISTNLWIPFFV